MEAAPHLPQRLLPAVVQRPLSLGVPGVPAAAAEGAGHLLGDRVRVSRHCQIWEKGGGHK